MAVRHCLLALPGVEKGNLRRVVSHYQALAQCDGYIRRLPGVVREAADDTAGAAQMIADTGCRRGPWRCSSCGLWRLDVCRLPQLPPVAHPLLRLNASRGWFRWSCSVLLLSITCYNTSPHESSRSASARVESGAHTFLQVAALN